MSNQDHMADLREQVADAMRNKSHYGVAETPVINAVMALIAQHDRAVRDELLAKMPEEKGSDDPIYTSAPWDAYNQGVAACRKVIASA